MKADLAMFGFFASCAIGAAVLIGVAIWSRPVPSRVGSEGEVWTNVWVTAGGQVMVFDRLIVSTNGLMAPKGDPGERFTMAEDPLEELVDTIADTGLWREDPVTNLYRSNVIHWIHLDPSAGRRAILNQWNRTKPIVE